MAFNTFFYSIRQGVRNIFHNMMFSVASVATMAACIFMFGIFYILVTNFNVMIQDAEESVAVTIFFEDNLTQTDIETIGEAISKREEVARMKYVSADEAWENFKDLYFEGNEDYAESFQDDNPLEHSANYEIYLADVSKQDELVEYLNGVEGIRSVKQSEDVANTLSDFNRLVSFISLGIIAILLAVSIFLISNTVSVGVAVRREEIGIMKLIGATDFLVRAPFIVEGVLIGLAGAALPLLLLYFMYGRICDYIANKFSFIGSMLNFVSTTTIFHTLMPVSLALGVGIGFVGSAVTLRKHLQV